jgi:hypothetical protein
MSNGILKPYDIDADNIKEITEDQLKEDDRVEFGATMEHYKKVCLSYYGQTKSGVIN